MKRVNNNVHAHLKGQINYTPKTMIISQIYNWLIRNVKPSLMEYSHTLAKSFFVPLQLREKHKFNAMCRK